MLLESYYKLKNIIFYIFFISIRNILKYVLYVDESNFFFNLQLWNEIKKRSINLEQ